MNRLGNKWILFGLVGLGGLVLLLSVVAVMVFGLNHAADSEPYMEEAEITGEISRGVLMKNEMSNNTLRFIKERGILKDTEKMIAFYDVQSNRTEIALLTSEGLVYYQQGRITRISYREMKRIHIYKGGADIQSIVLELENKEPAKVDISVERGADTFVHLLKHQWKSKTGK